MSYTFKQKLGCLLLDLPRLMPALAKRNSWIKAWNRNEKLTVADGGVDTSPVGWWSSDLYAAHVFPWIGRCLMNNALSQWPIALSEDGSQKSDISKFQDFRVSEFPSPDKRLIPGTKNEEQRTKNRAPKVSFIIPHRGKERLPHLLATVNSILAQEDIIVECLVVEQSSERKVFSLPDGVDYLHLPHPSDPDGWRKSWAFNEGVKRAKADIVICHDGDIPVPQHYAREIWHWLDVKQYDVCHLQRFLFCLDKDITSKVFENNSQKKITSLVKDSIPERIRQNWQGGTVAVRKEAFWRIGGYDESFVNWGGEDNEFYDRCQTLKVFKLGYLPFIHLWHAPQASKVKDERESNLKKLNSLLEIPTKERVVNLITATTK